MSGGRHAIVLAAGAATRFGGGKLTADWRGAPLVTWAVRAALAADVESVVVVVGADAQRVEAAVSELRDPRLKIVPANNWPEGLSASLRIGISALFGDAAAVAVFLGDMPLVDGRQADRLLDAVMAGAPAARLIHPRGPAHPTAFSAAAFPALLALTGDQGGRPVLDALGDQVATFTVDDDGAIHDIDRPEDLDTV